MSTKSKLPVINTECFYWCNPDKADTCKKTTCFRNGGNCYITMNPSWALRPITSDGVNGQHYKG